MSDIDNIADDFQINDYDTTNFEHDELYYIESPKIATISVEKKKPKIYKNKMEDLQEYFYLDYEFYGKPKAPIIGLEAFAKFVMKRDGYVNQHLTGDPVCSFYFDVDGYSGNRYQLFKKIRKFLKDLTGLNGKLYTTDCNDYHKILEGQYSSHAFYPELFGKLSDMKIVVDAFNLGCGDALDASVYKNGLQNFRCVLQKKSRKSKNEEPKSGIHFIADIQEDNSAEYMDDYQVEDIKKHLIEINPKTGKDINSFPKFQALKKKVENPIVTIPKPIFEEKQEKKIVEKKVNTFEYDKSIISELTLKALAEHRWEREQEWTQVGMALYGSYGDGGFEIWDNFSKKSKAKYPGQEELLNKWRNFKKGQGLTAGSIVHWAKEDNPRMYKKIKKSFNFPDYDIDIDPELFQIEIKENEEFSSAKLRTLVKKDIAELKSAYFKNFSKSRSYKYFNYFHVFYRKAKSSYRYIGEEHAITPLDCDDVIYEDVIDPVKEHGHKFVRLWIRMDDTKIAERIVFKPNTIESKDNEINLFTGLPFNVPSNDGSYNLEDIQPFLDHVSHLCCRRESEINYILNWVAHILQRPWVKSGACLFFYSHTHGVGKNFLTDILKTLFGKYYVKLEGSRDFTHNFNAFLEGKLLGVLDELCGRARETANEIKNRLTAQEIRIEQKGVNAYSVGDYLNYILTSNNENCVIMEDTDRRFLAVGCVEEKLSEEKIPILKRFLNEKDLQRQLHNYFMARDITNFDPRPLMTEHKKNLIVNDLPPYIDMIRRKPCDFAGVRFESLELFNMAQKFAIDHHRSTNFSMDKCSKDIAKYFVDYKKKINNTWGYTFPIDLKNVLDNILKSKIV